MHCSCLDLDWKPSRTGWLTVRALPFVQIECGKCDGNGWIDEKQLVPGSDKQIAKFAEDLRAGKTEEEIFIQYLLDSRY